MPKSSMFSFSGLHGYLHERQTKLTLEQQKDVLDRSYEVLTKFNNGIPPKGNCAPCWDTTRENTRLLLDKGIEYGEETYILIISSSSYLRRQTTPTWHMSTCDQVSALGFSSHWSRLSSQAYYVRTDDDWTKIDYQAQAETWMKPLVRGKETGLVEIPANWCSAVRAYPLCCTDRLSKLQVS